MKSLVSLVLFLFLAGCHQSGSSIKNSEKVVDTAIGNMSTDTLLKPSPFKKDQDTIVATASRKVDTVLLLKRSEEILSSIKNGDYRKLATYVDPQGYIRFSPYAHINIAKDKNLSPHQFLQLVQQRKKINWNSAFDEKPELLNVEQYFKKFVYDVDFLNAELKSVNQFHSQGTDLNNINEVYPGSDVVEFFFPGFEKKYEGLDFRALRLVYTSKSNELFLTGIIHDQWTP